MPMTYTKVASEESSQPKKTLKFCHEGIWSYLNIDLYTQAKEEEEEDIAL